jgi:hypothetical protein
VPSPEICDGIDNNCNGQIDEMGGFLMCPNGSVCVNGACQNCQPNVFEACDGVDNNCNGQIDENAVCPDPSQMCVNGACFP